jgi:ABC-type phosphate/phosphonate transport system substrate-binding protein
VASGWLDAELRGRVQKALLDLTANPAVAGVLKRAGLERFVVATDADYDPIRVLLERAREVKLAPVQPLHPNHAGGGLDEHAR